MDQKHYIDIQNIREDDDEFRTKNTSAFTTDSLIQITEKFDGSNASCKYDVETDKLISFSRKKQLNFDNTLNGFWNYVENLPASTKAVFKEYSNYYVFGEWSGNKNKIIYNDTGKIKHWYIYDIFDASTNTWKEQAIVKEFCKKANLEYIHELYSGKFISWEHCRSFMNNSAYGDTQKGIVIKNQTALLDNYNERAPFYLKIVNKAFKEPKNVKPIDPEKKN